MMASLLLLLLLLLVEAVTVPGQPCLRRYGGKVVMAGGMLWFSLASLIMPAVLSPSVVAAGWTVPAILASRCCVVGDWRAGWGGCVGGGRWVGT